MGLLEEYNALKKKRNPQANTSEKTSSAGSNTTTGKTDVVSEYNKLKKEREQGILTPDIQNKIKDFGSRYENAIKAHNNSVSESFWGKDASEIRIAQRANLSNVQALAKEAAKYRKYWGDETTDSILKSLEEIKGSQASIYDNAEIFSTYKSEDEYNKAVEQYLAQQKEEEELLKVNIELGEKEIYDLEQQRDNWREVDYNQRLQNVQPYTDEYWALQDEWYNWDNIIDEKKQYLEKAREFQEWNQQNEYYAGFKNNPDWVEKSKYETTYRGGEEISNGWDKNGNPMSIYLDTGYDDVVYDAINGDETARSRLSFNDDNKYNTFFGTDSGYLYHMTPDEKKTYNYLYDPNDKTASDAYLEFLHSELTARRRQADQMKQAEWAKEQPIRSSIFSVLTSPLKVISAVGQTADYIDDGKIDQNAGWNKYSYNSTAIRTQVASDIAASGKWGEVGSWTYQLGMSMGDFLMNTAVSGGNSTISLALMGSGAMADTVIAAKDRGLSDDQAFTLGVVAGAAEIVTEKFSLDALFKGGMSKGAVRYAVKNAFVEGTEEVSSSLINLVADTIVAKDKSEWEMAIQEYLKQHPEATPQEAEQKVLEDELLSLGLDFLGGVVMGGAMGGGGAAINAGVNAISTYAENNAQLKDTGRTIMSVDGGVDALKNLANEVAGVSEGETKSKLTKQVGKVSNKATAKNVGKLYNAVESANNQSNASANKADIAKSLQRKGFNAETANDIADALVAEYNGQELTKAQEKLLKSAKKSQVVKDAISNIVTNEQSTMGQRSQNIRNFNADIASGVISKETGISKDVVKALQEGDFEAALKMVGGEVTTETESAPESHYEVSADGKTINAKGDEITIVGIDSVGKGKLTLKLSDGSTIDSSEVSYSSVGEAMIYEAVANMDANIDADTAFKLVKAYDPASGISAEVYAKGLNQAYTYGFYGYKRSDMTAEKALSAVLTEEQRNYAYEAGREYAEKHNEGNDAGIKDAYATAKSILRNREKNGQTVDKSGEVIFEDGLTKEQITKSKNGKQKNVAYLVAQKVSAKMGNDIHLYKGAKEFGFRAKSGDIWLNVNATADAQSMMLFTLSHELVHNARVYDPKGFKAFADFLVEQYGEHGKSVHDMVLAKQADYASQGKKLSYDKAYEEVVCDACERMLLDSNALEKLQLLEQKHPGIIERIIESIRNFLKHIREVFADVDPYADESKFVKEMESEAQAVLNRLFENMMVDSGKHYSTIKAAFGKGTVVETNADGEFTIAKSDDGSEMLYNLSTWEKGGKETLQAALEAEGFSDEDIKAAMTIMDAKYDLVKKLGNEFNEQDRINQATITTDIKDGHSVLSALVSNGDYPVNIDLLMVCKKRKAYQRVINKLCETGMIQQATVDALAIAEINKILGKYGFETACLGCFVESRRLRIQEWANTIVKEWNSEVKKRNPNAKAFGFGKGVATLTQDEVMQLIGELESGGDKNDQGNLNLGKGSAVKRMGVLLDKVPSLRKTLSVEDLITPDGLTALRKFDSNLFSMVKSRYGSNSPKFVQEFNPYNHELAKYGKVPSEYKSLREYLYAIGGARMQSFSDFIVENWFDYCQIVADLAARKLPMHTYTKEIALAKLFGLTGIKINMSLIPDIDRSLGKEFAGLTRNAKGELELIWADKDRFKATGGKSYMQSINFADAIALQNDPRYSANVGTIAVGVSDKHILMMLDDNRIRMIIPYHSSGMNPIFADLMGTSFYKDYTMFQNTTVKQLYNSKGEPVSLKLEKAQNDKLVSGFQFNAVLQELGDARAAAQAYKDWCADASKHTITIKGETYTAELTPKFDSFSWHDNYYKLLEDFNTYDCISEEAAQQGDVQQIYPEDFDGILRAELTAQDKYRQKQEENQSFDKAMGEIEAYLSTHSKADTVYYAEQNGIKLSDKDKKLNADEKRKLKALRDADMKLAKGEQDTSQEMDADRITIGMSDTERTAILQKKSLVAEVYEGQAEEAIKHNKADLESGKMGLVKSALVKIGEEFRVFIDYNIADVDVKIRLSRGNIKESVSKEITPTQIVKLLPVLKTAVENAVGIESHVNRYFFDDSTVFFENLLGGYVDGDYFVPVRFGLKHSTTGEATLYVIVDQQPVESKKIKAEVVKIPGTQNVSPAISRSAYKVSIANLAEFVNGKDLLRYLPDDMLSGEQKKAKWEAIAETVKKTNTKNDAKYTEFLASGNLRAAQNMVKQAAKVAGYTIEAWHGSRHIFDKFSKNKLGSNSHTKASHSWFFAGDKETANSYYPYGVMKELARQSPNIWKDSDAENMRYKGKLYALYLKMENPLIVDVAGYDYAAHAESKDAFMEYVEQAERNGNDGIILLHVRDNQLRPSAEESTVYMFREPSQAKLADTITYDEQDNVVPISERFNEERDELSYKLPNTLRDAQTAATMEALEKQNEKLREDVSFLKELLNLQRSVTGGKKITRSSVETVARTLKKELGATGNSLELAGYLNQLYSFIAESDELTWEGIAEKAQNAVAWLREHGNVENDSFKELSDQELLRKVYDGYWGVSTLHTVADVKQKEINKLKAEHRKRMQAIKESHEKSIANLKQQQKQRIEDLREFYHKSTDRKLDAAKERYQEQRQRGIENREKTAMRQKIRKIVRDLDKLLNRGNKKTNVKEDMKGFVSKALELADYLFTDHISNDELIRRGITVRMTPKEAALVKETEGIISQLYDNADSLTDEEFTRLDAERKRNLDKLRDLLTAQRNERLNTPVYKLFNDLITEYASLNNSKQEAVKAAYDPNVERFLRSYIGESDGETDSDRKTLLQNMRVADMTTDELWKLHNAYKMVLHSVRDANKLWVKGKMDTIEQMVGRIIGDFSKRKTPDGKVDTVTRNLSNKLGWNYEKLYYALDRIGSEAFTELVMNIANSENIVMQDVLEAAAFRDEMVEKYGYNNWDVNKKIDREFLDNTGKKFELTLGELMSLYAYSRRKGAWDHIEYGGFVFGKAALTNPKPADAYKLSKEQCEAITDTLTNEQKAYAEDMQKFLSETMGEKGNEVSMLLYGITMFGEKNYFPIHIAGQFKAQANESQAKAAAGFSSMSNAGFTHAQNPNAKTPFVLEGFNEIWADHVNEMSRYHGTVPALEDMRRVMNRSFYSETGADSIAIKQLMENSFGKEAVEYFDNLYREANSGAITDKLQKSSHKWLSKFRKNSVAYSLSVLIQQPASVVRAYALIPKKYFRGIRGIGALPIGIAQAATSKWTKSYKNAYAEMLKYAPGVTMAKEIGGFDTATGGSIRSYLLDTNKSFKQKWKTETVAGKAKAGYDLVDDNPIANLPNVADKIAWIEIWNACKRETVAKHKDLAPNSEAFMQAVGDRFTEVIRATQVYDSIFAKSPMLKSKNLAVQYLVSFMNEPNTTANLAESAVRDFIRGDIAKGFRKATTVVRSIFFTCVLKSIIYAMRDDDEDETYIEKYTEALVGSLISDITVFNYIPIAKDLWSVAQGYDVERPDMSIVSDAISSFTNVINNSRKDTSDMTEEELEEWDKKVSDANWKLADSICAFFGIPEKNVRREIIALMDHARIAHENSGKTTWTSIEDAVNQAIADASPAFAKPNTESKHDKLYDAIVSGDTTYVNRLKSGYKDQNAINNAIRKGLRENDPRIRKAAIAWNANDLDEYMRIAKEVIAEKHFVQDDVVMAIRAEANAIAPDAETETKSKAKGLFTAEKFAEAIAQGDQAMANAIKVDIVQTEQKNGKTAEEAEKSFKSSATSELKDLFLVGEISESKAIKALETYCGKTESEAMADVQYWTFKQDYPDVYADDQWFDTYYEKVADSGISINVYMDYRNKVSSITGEGKEEKRMAVINSLPITSAQKDALYYAEGWTASKLYEAPWH